MDLRSLGDDWPNHNLLIFSSGESVLDLCYVVRVYELVNVPELVMIKQINMH